MLWGIRNGEETYTRSVYWAIILNDSIDTLCYWELLGVVFGNSLFTLTKGVTFFLSVRLASMFTSDYLVAFGHKCKNMNNVH